MADSQSSSFDESTASQNSRPVPPSSNARLSQTNPPPGEITPLTSFSNPSSQDPLAGDALNSHDFPTLRTEGQSDLRAESPSSGRPHSNSPPNDAPTPQDDCKVSQKRMANGEVKRAAKKVSKSLVDHQASRSSQIGEANSPVFIDHPC